MKSLAIPKDLPSLISPQGKQQLNAAEELLNALGTLEIQVTLPDGTQLKGTLQALGGRAIVDVR